MLGKGDNDGSGGLDFDEFYHLYSKCLSSTAAMAHFSEKALIRFDEAGEWYLEAVRTRAITTTT